MIHKIASYGAEHEWADWPLSRPSPRGFGRDKREKTLVNSNRVAADPSGKVCAFGGEHNTPPTETIEGQLDCFEELQLHFPEASINYRCDLHTHVRIPGLRGDLKMLKQIQRFIHRELPKAFATVFQLPDETQGCSELAAAWRYMQGRKRMHQTLLSDKRLQFQLAAETVDEFFAREAPLNSGGQTLWACQPRVSVNLRQLLQTDTIEFRHFAAARNVVELYRAFGWTTDFMYHALDDCPIDDMLCAYGVARNTYQVPTCLPFHSGLEAGWQKTNRLVAGTSAQKEAARHLSEEYDLPSAQAELIKLGYVKGIAK